MYLNHKLSNACITLKVDGFFKDFSDEKLLEYIKDLNICNYIVFQREFSEKKREHWQMYLEFKKRQYLFGLRKKFKYVATYIEKNYSEKVNTINYVKKEKTRIGDKYHEWGEPKNNTGNSKKKQNELEKIEEEIIQEKYKNLSQLKDDLNLRNWEEKRLEKSWKKTMLEKSKKSTKCVRQCRVVWVFGKSGSGKSVWTKSFLYSKERVNENDVCVITPNNTIGYKKQMLFKEWDEGSKVLVINEVDKNFPEYNDLISFIDKENLLKIDSGRYMINSFELVVINSLWRPEEVFECSGKEKIEQILRRIYDIQNGSKVFEIAKNKEQLEKLKKRMDPEKFVKWYKPILTVHSEPDYSLIEGE